MATLFEWSADCEVGIPEFDAQHRQIIDLLTELRRAQTDGAARILPDALAKINGYSSRHLQREELLLRVRQYPGYVAHKAEHDAYRSRVEALQRQTERRDFAVRISNFLTEWWRYHILTCDQQYARYFRLQSAGGSNRPIP